MKKILITGDGVKKPRGVLSYETKVCAKQADLVWGKMGIVKTGVAQGLTDYQAPKYVHHS